MVAALDDTKVGREGVLNLLALHWVAEDGDNLPAREGIKLRWQAIERHVDYWQ